MQAGFLGHCNSESNKKFPEEEHMLLVRPLMRQRHGKDKYKKTGSINHGVRQAAPAGVSASLG